MNHEMEYPRAKALLEQTRIAQKRVDLLKERIACIDMMLTDKSVHLTQVRVCGGGDPQKNERLIAQKDELEREQAAAEKERDQVFEEVKWMISRIREPKAQKVLILYYLNGKTWEQAAAKIHYSKVQAYRFRDIGYQELEEILKNEA